MSMTGREQAADVRSIDTLLGVGKHVTGRWVLRHQVLPQRNSAGANDDRLRNARVGHLKNVFIYSRGLQKLWFTQLQRSLLHRLSQ